MDTLRDYLLSGTCGLFFKGQVERGLDSVGRDLALLGIVLGVLYLLFGWRIFRLMLSIQAALLGFWLGSLLGGYAFITLTCGVVLAGLVAYWSWKHTQTTATVLMGVYAALIALGLFMGQRWIGGRHADWLNLAAAIGVGATVAAFVRYAQQPTVIALSALHGAAGVLGGLAALLLAFDATHRFTLNWLKREPLLLPVAVLVLAVIGAIYQWRIGGQGGGKASAGQEKPARESAAPKRKRMAA